MRQVEQLELPLWEALREATSAPDEADLQQLLKVLDEALLKLDTVGQLQVAAEAITQIVQVFQERSATTFEELELTANDHDPVMPEDAFDRYVRQTMAVDFEQFVEPLTQLPRKIPERQELVDDERSLVGVVDNVLLAVVAQIEAEPDPEQLIRQLAGEEDVGKWSAAIAHWMQQYAMGSSVLLPNLVDGLEMPLVEVWLGLLLGGYELEQQGNFYDGARIQIQPLIVQP